MQCFGGCMSGKVEVNIVNYNAVHCVCLEENAWQGNTLVFNQKKDKM